MNVFYLHEDPKTCAEMHIDKHCVKMIIEYAQLMSTAHRVLDGLEYEGRTKNGRKIKRFLATDIAREQTCLLYTSPSPRDVEESRMPSSA